MANTTATFAATFDGLKSVLKKRAGKLKVLLDEPGHYSMASKTIVWRGKPLWFGGVQVKKTYVSFHLMPVYMNPALLAKISPELKKRMQGKSCFNFTAPDEKLFRELGKLADAGLKFYATVKLPTEK